MSRRVSVRSKRPRAWGIGLVALDIIIEDDSPEPRIAAGGSCGNVMAILARLGWDARPVARIGTDSVAGLITADLQRWDVNTSLLHLRPFAKASVIVEKIRKDSAGVPFHTFSFSCPGCGRRFPSYQPVTARSVLPLHAELKNVEVLFIDRASRGALDLAHSAIENGTIVFFEPSASSNPRQISKLLRLAHIIKYSHDRLGDASDINWGPNTLVEIQTLGRGGLRFRTKLDRKNPQTWRSLSALPVTRLRDAAGSGDWLSSGLIYSLCSDGLQGLRQCTLDRLIETLNFGQRLAAWNCDFPGARGGMYALSSDRFEALIKELCYGRPSRMLSEVGVSDHLQKITEAICEMCAPNEDKKIGNLAVYQQLRPH